MAYDQALAERVRHAVKGQPGVVEKAMFGGIAFSVGGNMACGVAKDDLTVRVGPDGHDAAVARPHVRAMDLGGKPIRGMVVVAPAGTRTQAEVDAWAKPALALARSLPPKAPKAPKKKKDESAGGDETA